MNSKYVLVEHISDINTIIKQPLQSTHRIKFTAFDVSKSYVVFGASSGGLYVFNRHPHQFLKLIPSKEGAIVQVCISHDEKHLSLATSKGAVVIIPNCFYENCIQYHTHHEHRGNIVTAIKWNGDELYCGDNLGKITVITLPSLLAKAMFQANYATLMQLDSRIVQIDVYSKFLLISTLTRTHICDTDKEQYRQIGKKLRNGHFGACFFSNQVDVQRVLTETLKSRGIFKKSIDDEQVFAQINDNVQIFCTRPGARVWEAKLNGSVTRTHQFKNLFKNPAEVIRWDGNVDSRLTINSSHDINLGMEQLNFRKVLILDNKFVVTFNQGMFYVFDPVTENIICWCNYYENIKDFKVTDYFIYIWDDNLEVRVVALYMLEQIILKTLFRKQYYLSAELCVHYTADIIDLIELANNIHLVTILKEKITDQNLLASLLPIFTAIDSYTNKKIAIPKLKAGIVTVNPYFDDENITKDRALEELHIFKDLSLTVPEKLGGDAKNLKEKFHKFETTVKKLAQVNNGNGEFVVSSCDDQISSDGKVFQQQYQMSKINQNLESPKFSQLLDKHSVHSIVQLFHNFLKSYKTIEAAKKEVRLWCFSQYLKYLSNHRTSDIQSLNNDDIPVQYALEAFTELNQSSCTCTCSYPTPSAKRHIPQYFELGCVLAKKLSRSSNQLDELTKKVPYMWKYILKDQENDNALPLLIQFGDEDLIQSFSNKFTYDDWDDAVKLLIKLRNFKCVNCEQDITRSTDVMSWMSFGTILLKSVGAQSTINLLMRYSNVIPSDELNANFYQMCIFTSAVGGVPGKAVGFAKVMQSNDTTMLEFDNVMKKFLRRSYVKKPPSCEKRPSLRGKTDLRCSFCDLLLETPLLTDYVTLSCKHLYHSICYKYNENICGKCK
ncbi:hypothetical protein PPYR_07227 [Photinus pyralis]|uniref:RING-type domain-containing protein n=1 Tax=Photinus pyralis TaxID=7054 RepID=A0A5N4APU5_PHOPY|nr:Hermansky-Pudlak syndrome 5 protein homolog [Photinus pyralis]KAB0799347.1 hypothetical protein PPYR_07227 [Photinus pyralis]